jgi:hypothetical protein
MMNSGILLLLFLASTLAALYRDNFGRDCYVCKHGRNWSMGISSVNTDENTPSEQITSFATASRTKPGENLYSGLAKVIGLFFGMPFRNGEPNVADAGGLAFELEEDGDDWVGNLGEEEWILTKKNNKSYKNRPELCYDPDDQSSNTLVGLWNRISPAAGDPDPDGLVSTQGGGVVPHLRFYMCENGLGWMTEKHYVSGVNTFQSRWQGVYVVHDKGFVGEQDVVSIGDDDGICSQIVMLIEPDKAVGDWSFTDPVNGPFFGIPEIYARIEDEDDEDRRYFKQQEIHLWRKSSKKDHANSSHKKALEQPKDRSQVQEQDFKAKSDSTQNGKEEY